SNAGSVAEGLVNYTRYVSGDAEVRVEEGLRVSFPQPFDLNLTFLTPTQGFIVQGDAAGDYAGFSVSSAGDVNGDGFADLIVGAPRGDDGGSNAGEAYVVFGKTTGFGAVDGTGRSVMDLADLDPSDGFIVRGDSAGDNAGWSVASAGDVNGDGFDDLIIGARLSADGGSTAGEAFLIFGKSTGFTNIDLSALAPADGFRMQGDSATDQA